MQNQLRNSEIPEWAKIPHLDQLCQALFEATAWLAVARLGRMDMHARDILRDGRHGKSEPDPYWAGWVEPTDWVSYSDQEWERRRAKEQIS